MRLPPFARAFVLSCWLPLLLAQQGQPPAPVPTPPAPSTTPATPPAATPPTATPPGEPAATQDPERPAQGEGRRRGGAGRRGRGGEGGEAGNEPQDPEGGDKPAEPPKPPRRGIAVSDPLVHTHCARCHELNADQMMTRISYLRMSPEGWQETLKRMIRLHGMQVSPSDAKALVRSLANSHGLTRTEAERGLYESERRVHWSEESADADFKRACAQCHTLGRVLGQQRDDEEWQLLRATHVAMFPLSRGQMGGGPQQEDEGFGRFGGRGNRGARSGPPVPGGNSGVGLPAAPGANQTDTANAGARGGRGNQGGGQGGPGGGQQQGVGDRVLAALAKNQPLFTPEWEHWTVNRREVPLGGTWTVSGHEIGRGDVHGTAVITRTDVDEYEVRWHLEFADGTVIDRSGRGFLYAGYSWRGRSTDPGDKGATWREVLLLDENWQHFRGRCFTGNHDEIGVDLQLRRHHGRPSVHHVGNRAVIVPFLGHTLDLFGESFPDAVRTEDLVAGAGVTITQVERLSATRLRVRVDVAPGTELGERVVAWAGEPGSATIYLYDAVDYVRITPRQGLARVGGARHPRQIERFEALAVHRGKDKKAYTDDDIDLYTVRPKFGLAEFAVRENDDDLQYVGAIDPVSGVFTPNIDGPNPARKWQANNVGDVFVTAEVELDVPVRPPEPKPEPKPAAKPDDKPAAPGQGEGDKPVTPPPPPPPKPAEPPAKTPTMQKKVFRSRTHLVVTVPLYARWNSLEWEDR
ncbi:MAG: hypothetical protein IPK26_15915 [Planctomycetes bacterium]|nr:hypothetical protein [Planctomycetota bacterium]